MRRFDRSWSGISGSLLVLVLAFALQTPPPASAQDPARVEAPAPTQLTSRGRLLGSGAIGGSWSGSGSSPSRSQSYRVYASPALIYFVRDRLGVGLTVGGSVGKSLGVTSSRRASDFFIGVLAAFDLPISDQVSVLLQPAFHYVNQWNEDSVSRPEQPPSLITFPDSLHMQIVRPALALQLVVRISPYVGFVFGPDFWADIIVDDGGLRRIQAMLTGKKQTYMRAQLGLSAGLLLSF